MAEWHLSELENRLNKIGWNIVSRKDGNDYDISAYWVLNRNSEIIIDFNGLDDLETLPLNKSYACVLRSDEFNTSLYFHKKGKTWKKKLDIFIEKINKL